MCSKYEDKVCIAVYSSPVACTLSGCTDELKDLTDSLKGDEKDGEIFIRELKVKCAYHSPLLQGCMDEIRTRVDKSLKKRSSKRVPDNGETIPMISTVTGEPAVASQMRTGSYWASNIRQPVRFMQSIKEAFDENNHTIYLEIGPRPVLRAHLSNILESASRARTIPSMLPKRESQCLYRSLSELYELGIDIDHSTFIDPKHCQMSRFPKYAFNRTAELFVPINTNEYLAGYTIDKSHMFVQTAKSANETKFEVSVDAKSTPFVYDHFLSEKIIVPGATYVETGFHIGMELFKKPVDRLSVAFSFSKTFSPSTGKDHKLNIRLNSKSTSEVQFAVINVDSTLANGTVTERSIPMRNLLDIDYLKVQCPNYKSKSDCYDCLGKFNFRYGDSLRLIQGAWVSESETKCLTEICVPDNLSEELTKTHFHPSIIDSMFQIFGMMIKELANEDGKQLFVVPKGVSAVVVNKPVEQVMYGYGEEVKVTDSSTHYNAVLLSTTGAVIAEFENFYTKIISSDMKQFDKSYTYSLTWSEVPNVPNSIGFFKPETIILFSSKTDSELGTNLEKHAKVVYEEIGETLSIPSCGSYENTMIIYHASSKKDKHKENETVEVFDDATKRFTDMKQLLAAIKALDANLPIAVITENTQQCPSRQTIDYNGSELWGMLRSAIHEGSSKNVKLIDLERDNFDTDVLMRVLSLSNEDETEFALTGSTLYQPKLRSAQKRCKSKRNVALMPSDKMAVYSSKQSEIKDPYLLMSSSTMSLANSESVALDSLITHTKDLYSPAIGIMGTRNLLLQKQGEEDFQVIAIEGRGRSEKTDDDVMFLYPINAETTVDIPSDQILNKSECPFESNGILILTNILVQIASEVADGTDVAVIKYAGDVDIGHEMFTHIMKENHCETLFLTTKDLQEDGVYSNIHTLIITTILLTDKWKLIVKSLPEIKQIISLTLFVPEHLRLWLKQYSPDIQLTVLSPDDMLSANQIKKTMPKIKECLRQFQSHQEGKQTNQFVLDLPMNTLNVKEQIKDGTLKCFCNINSLFRSQASYVVVGGLTGLGWELLQLMAEMGAGVLVTLSRRLPSNEIQEEIDNLQHTHHCQIVPLQADISDLYSVKQAFAEIHQRFKDFPIKGIFHGAGVLSDSVLENLDEQKVQDVLKPKISGAWNLHLASLNCSLDYFVLHSSIVSVLGNPGQCNYAAANSFIDSFALYRRSKGLSAQSINWGALSVGMAVENDEIKKQLQRSGFTVLDKKMIREFFLEAVVNDDTNVVYADIKWEKLMSLPTFSMKSSKYSEFHSNRLGPRAKKVIEFDIEEMKNLSKEEQTIKVKACLREIIHEQMVIEDEALKDDTSITDIGIDSMAAMSLSNRIDEVFKCRISLVILLSEGTTFASIAENIRQNAGSSANDSGLDDLEDDFDEQAFFESKDFTFMQLDLLEKYKYNRDDPYYLRVIDVELTELKFQMDDWNAILRHVMKMNPELRKKFYFSEDGKVTVETITEDCPEIDLAKIPDITMEDKNAPDIRLSLPTDIHSCLPVSFKISETEEMTILRIITHALVSDIRGLSILCRDIDATIPAYFYKTGLPERPVIDIPAVVKRSIMPRMNELGNYWRGYLNLDIEPVTLGESLQEVDDKFCSLSFVSLPQETVFAIKKFIAKQGVTLYEFIMSLYQLYLYIGSNRPFITVGTAADMRSHVPEMSNVITRCVNYVPTVARIDPESTILDFIKENSIGLSSTTLHGAYPNSLILKKLKTVEARENIFRHFIAMHDMTEINKVMEEENSRAKVRQVWYMRHNRETFLFVRYDLRKAWITLEIGQNTKICGQYGERFSDYMLYLADVAMSSGNKKIAEVRDLLMNADVKDNLQIGAPTASSDIVVKLDTSKPKSKFTTTIDVHTKKKQGIGEHLPAIENAPPRTTTLQETSYAKNSQPSLTETQSISHQHRHRHLQQHYKVTSSVTAYDEPQDDVMPKMMKKAMENLSNYGAMTPQHLQHMDNKKARKVMKKMRSEMMKHPDRADMLESKKVKKNMEKISKGMPNGETFQSQSILSMNETSPSFSSMMHDPEITVHLTGKEKDEMELTNKSIVLAGLFEKQTSHGWDHKVHVSLSEVDGRFLLSWGKKKWLRKTKSKLIDLSSFIGIVMREMNGTPTLILSAAKRMLVLKTQDHFQAAQWLDVLQWAMAKPLKKHTAAQTASR